VEGGQKKEKRLLEKRAVEDKTRPEVDGGDREKEMSRHNPKLRID
jgi:hypothetical protein